MKPGRKMDALVGRHVMGATGRLVPEYSTKIEAAWDVAEWLARQYHVRLLNRGDGWGVDVSIINPGPPSEDDVVEIEDGDAESAPHAICLAALQIVRVA